MGDGERLKIAIIGAGGRMGREVAIAALRDPGFQIVGAVDAAGSLCIGQDVGSLCGQGQTGILVADSAEPAARAATVLIEFSSPAASVEHAELAARLGKAAVIGTTGFTADQLELLRLAAESTPILLAPNMSVGICLLLKVLPLVAQALGDSYDVEIVETHHRHKKDAPSGTALALGQAIAAALSRDWSEAAVYGRRGVAPRQPGEIGLHALRGGGSVGEHLVLFANDGEEIAITHRALSRQTFALGALRAARYVAGRAPGLYSMQHALEG